MAEVWDDAQAAWAEWVSHQYLDRNSIGHAREAFMAGWRAARERSDKEREQDERRRRY